MTTRCLAAD